MTMRQAVYVFSLLVVMTQSAAAADYYFSALGNDSLGDGSLTNPWRSITKLNSLDLDAGDEVLFRAGDTFAGNVVLQASDSATNGLGVFGGSPISFGAYGDGNRPIISSPTGHGLRATNAGGLRIQGLEFAGANSVSAISSLANTTRGLFFENTESTYRQQHIYLDDVVVHGFGDAGISLQATNPTLNSGGFDDVRITNSTVYSNGRSGIVSSVFSPGGTVVGGSEYDFQARAHSSFQVANNRVRDTTGKNEASGVSGNGIVLAQVEGAVVERNVAHHNGGLAGGGGVGIWAWESDDVTIQFNEAYQNQTFDGRDGGGFDLDGGVRNSVMQYNYSHGNEGAGLGLFQFGYASKMGGNTIRYNISEADGAGISVWGSGPRFDGVDVAEDSIFHNNTVINPTGPAVHFFGSVDDVGVYNNILVSDEGRPLVKLDDWDGAGNAYVLDVNLRGNAYWNGDDEFAIDWAGVDYASLAAWANATGQEKIAGLLFGRQVDPQLVGPFMGGTTLDNPEQLSSLGAYRLRANSALIDAGIELSTLPLAISLGLTDAGMRDFFGAQLPIGGGLDIGTNEAPLPGDYNRNGEVDAADFTLWRDSQGQVGAGLAADGNGDGAVTLDDYNVWRAKFGSSGSAAHATEAVPEPAIWAALSLAFVGLAIQRRRYGRQRRCWAE